MDGGGRRWEVGLVAALTALASCLGDLPEDYNSVRADEFESVLDRDTPMVDFEVEACSTEPHLSVYVNVGMTMPEGAIVGVTMVHAERISTGFGEEVDEVGSVHVRVIEVFCDEPIDVTVERLDAALEGEVYATTRIAANAEGFEGSTDLEVIQ